MIRVAVTGASGLVGECLVRLLLQHPEAEVAYLASHSSAGRQASDVLPSLEGQLALAFGPPDADAVARAADIAILAHKSAESLKITPVLLDAGVKVRAGQLALLINPRLSQEVREELLLEIERR